MQYASSWIELNKSAFDHNVRQYRAMIGSQVALTVVIKSNAYGHGLLPIAQLCQEHPEVNGLQVVMLSDALFLRTQGITKSLIVLQSLDADITAGILHNIEMVAHDWHHMQLLQNAARQCGIPVRIHLKVDTGLSRLGFLPQEVPEVVRRMVQEFPELRLAGIWSHFAESDAEDQWYTQEQHQRFAQVIATIKPLLTQNVHIHLANSTATARFIDKRFTMVRCAGGIYGFAKSEKVQEEIRALYSDFSLQPLLTWKTRIMALKEVPEGAYVGYARTYQAKRPLRTAVVPVGYYDGYVRSLSNKGMMLIDNTLVPVIGRVSMNATILDVTALPHVSHGQEVIVMGPHAGVSVYDHARLTETIGYEVLTRINPLLPRIIV